MNNYMHGYTVSLLGSTNTNDGGIRISAQSGAITIPFHNALSTIDAAIKELKRLGVKVKGYTSIGSPCNGFYVVLGDNLVSLGKEER